MVHLLFITHTQTYTNNIFRLVIDENMKTNDPLKNYYLQTVNIAC